jgi:hypothetical protein
MTDWNETPSFDTGTSGAGGSTAWRAPEFKLAKDIRPRLENMGLVKGIIDREQLSLMYGLPSCGKTFLALDRDLSIAAGLPWFGHKTRQGPVVYLACEAGRSIENRIWAWLREHGRERQDIKFAVITSPVDLCHLSVGDVDRVADTIRAKISWAELALLEIDTVSRAMAGGDENGPADMGAFVHAMDMFRGAFHCHVSGVHHISGKGNGKGPRGHSCLPAAMDTEQEVARLGDSKISRMTVNKRRDGVAGEQLHFELPQLVLGQDEDGDDVTTCIVRATEQPAAGKGGNASVRLTDQDKIALQALIKAIDHMGVIPPASDHIPTNKACIDYEQWREYAYNGGIGGVSDKQDTRQRAFKRCSDKLIAEGIVCRWQSLVWKP